MHFANLARPGTDWQDVPCFLGWKHSEGGAHRKMTLRLKMLCVQDEATVLKKASNAEKKTDLAKRVTAFPKRLQEAVAYTAEDDIFLNHIGDR